MPYSPSEDLISNLIIFWRDPALCDYTDKEIQKLLVQEQKHGILTSSIAKAFKKSMDVLKEEHGLRPNVQLPIDGIKRVIKVDCSGGVVVSKKETAEIHKMAVANSEVKTQKLSPDIQSALDRLGTDLREEFHRLYLLRDREDPVPDSAMPLKRPASLPPQGMKYWRETRGPKRLKADTAPSATPSYNSSTTIICEKPNVARLTGKVGGEGTTLMKKSRTEGKSWEDTAKLLATKLDESISANTVQQLYPPSHQAVEPVPQATITRLSSNAAQPVQADGARQGDVFPVAGSADMEEPHRPSGKLTPARRP